MFSMYGFPIIHLIVDSLFTHFFIVKFGRKVSAFYVLIFTLIHISYVHIERMYYDYGGWTLDVTSIYMMSIAKFSSMAFSYEDGGKDEATIINGHMKEK